MHATLTLASSEYGIKEEHDLVIAFFISFVSQVIDFSTHFPMHFSKTTSSPPLLPSLPHPQARHGRRQHNLVLVIVVVFL